MNGWLDPTQVGRFPVQSVPQNIQSVVSILDEPLDIAMAVEPAVQDLEPIYEDYQLGPGDTVRITIFELLAEGTASTYDVQLSETGYVSIPILGSLRLEDLSAREAEAHLADLLSPEIIRNPRVTVQIVDRRHDTFEMLGAFAAPGSYVIPRPAFRLLDAVAIARDLQPGIETIYVLRSYEYETQELPVEETAVPAATFGADEGPGEAGMPSAEALRDMMPAPAAAEPQQQGTIRRPMYIEGQWVEVPAPATAEATATAPAATAPAAGAQGLPADLWETEPPMPYDADLALPYNGIPAAATTTSAAPAVDWTAAVTGGSSRRVLRIPVRDLLRGDPRYNVVIRPDDKVYAWLGPVGEFYVIGNVYRPGVFSLTGRKITVRQAIAAAGGLAPLAWPDRCELIRRYNDETEEIIRLNLDAIFAGTQPDVVLKPNDTINVGTSIVAPFMATVRNAFRMTYGFGFVYDRNFADIDSYAAKPNPAVTEQQNLAQRFGSLFR